VIVELMPRVISLALDISPRCFLVLEAAELYIKLRKRNNAALKGESEMAIILPRFHAAEYVMSIIPMLRSKI
jgi:hypothetical protein